MIGGHGHVIPRADGNRARCGGPACCTECARELAQLGTRRLDTFDAWIDELDGCIASSSLRLDRDRARTVMLAFAAHVREFERRHPPRTEAP